MTQPYGVRDVEKLLHLSRSTIRALVAAGFVSPLRSARGAWQFSFQDLIVLRTAQALADANVPARRITKAVRELRRHLPETMPLSGLRIGAVADRVVVREGAARWQAETGQYLLEFDGDPAQGSLSVIVPDRAAASHEDAHAWFAKGVTLETRDPASAVQAYRHAMVADPMFLDARINLGRLLHETKQMPQAEQVYRDAIKACGEDPVLLFNLGALYDDLDRAPEAVRAYEAAVRRDPAMADGHFNLSLLYEKLARPRDALRHMARYRMLTAARSK
ncbi:MAG: tetratricopeptide repeat protein [Casimicrobiaceae bacterium]